MLSLYSPNFTWFYHTIHPTHFHVVQKVALSLHWFIYRMCFVSFIILCDCWQEVIMRWWFRDGRRQTEWRQWRTLLLTRWANNMWANSLTFNRFTVFSGLFHLVNYVKGHPKYVYKKIKEHYKFRRLLQKYSLWTNQFHTDIACFLSHSKFKQYRCVYLTRKTFNRPSVTGQKFFYGHFSMVIEIFLTFKSCLLTFTK